MFLYLIYLLYCSTRSIFLYSLFCDSFSHNAVQVSIEFEGCLLFFRIREQIINKHLLIIIDWFLFFKIFPIKILTLLHTLEPIVEALLKLCLRYFQQHALWIYKSIVLLLFLYYCRILYCIKKTIYFVRYFIFMYKVLYIYLYTSSLYYNLYFPWHQIFHSEFEQLNLANA